jgi:hypothetical protein
MVTEGKLEPCDIACYNAAEFSCVNAFIMKETRPWWVYGTIRGGNGCGMGGCFHIQALFT